MAIRKITAPAVTPVTLAEAKAHLNVDFSDDDSLIALYLASATDTAQEFMGRAIVEQTLELVIDEFPDEGVRLPYPPLVEVVSVYYDREDDGFETPLSDAEYVVDNASEPGWVVPVTSWPATIAGINAVRIRYIAGYAAQGSPADYTIGIPGAIKAAVLLTLGTLYAHRSSVVVGVAPALLPWSAEQLLRQYRIHTAMA